MDYPSQNDRNQTDVPNFNEVDGSGVAEQIKARPRPGVADVLAAETKSFQADLKPFLPSDIFGGSIPHIPGTEEEAVWNAASQACGTERVNYCYTVDAGRCWYLAVPSVALSSAPDTWCPLAAALPGNSEYWDRSTVYLYEQEGVASALRWDPETSRMQVYIGASRTLLPRIQSMDANFVTINPDGAVIVPWKNRALRTEKLSRATAMMLVASGVVVGFLAVLLILFQMIATGFVQRDLAKVRADSDRLSNDLMINAYGALQSDSIRHMVRIQELLDTLRTIEGTLVKYEVKGGRVTWEALVPRSFSQGVGRLRGTIKPGIEPDGRVRLVGTS